LEYFIPSLFLIFVVSIIPTSILNNTIALLNLFVIGVYITLVLINVVNVKGLKLKILTALGIFFTHLTYGAFFLKGIFINKLVRQRKI